jgi:hypothetical protein
MLQTAAVGIVINRFISVLSIYLQDCWLARLLVFRLVFPDIDNAQFAREGALHAESDLPVQGVDFLFLSSLLPIGFPHAQRCAAPQSLMSVSPDADAQVSATNKQTSLIRETTRDGGNYRLRALSRPWPWPSRKPASRTSAAK